jgi:hypothetical protein
MCCRPSLVILSPPICCCLTARGGCPLQGFRSLFAASSASIYSNTSWDSILLIYVLSSRRISRSTPLVTGKTLSGGGSLADLVMFVGPTSELGEDRWTLAELGLSGDVGSGVDGVWPTHCQLGLIGRLAGSSRVMVFSPSV